MWIAFIFAIAAVCIWFWQSNQRRGKRFVRAVHFLNALDHGATPAEANGIVARFFTKHSTADLDHDAIHFARNKARERTQGKQLPWINEARNKGLIIDSGNTNIDLAHLSKKNISAGNPEDLYIAAGHSHITFLNTTDYELNDEEFAASAIGAFDGTVQGLEVKLTDIEMFSLGAAFIFHQFKLSERLGKVDPEKIADLTTNAMESSGLKEIREEAGHVAYNVTMMMRP